MQAYFEVDQPCAEILVSIIMTLIHSKSERRLILRSRYTYATVLNLNHAWLYSEMLTLSGRYNQLHAVRFSIQLQFALDGLFAPQSK